MSGDQRTRKIGRGEIWIDRMDSSQVVVVSAGEKYVEFMRHRTTEIYYLSHFHERFDPYYHRKAIRDQFQKALFVLDGLHAFWCPEQRRLFSRTARREPSEAYKPSRGRGGALPASALYIGTYTYPFNADEFLGDLDGLITKLNAERRTANAHERREARRPGGGDGAGLALA